MEELLFNFSDETTTATAAATSAVAVAAIADFLAI